ncbi:MAG: TrkA family potassium uptake protein [Epsilonproteobacteria bacterium]|nr:TrkA family potassium uptake protein [Campylobacterota bacterium]
MRKMVIFGYSKTGREIAKLLKEEELNLTIIDENPMLVAEANEDGFFGRYSSFKDDKIFSEVGIGKDVEVLFCVSDVDSMNLFVTLSARNMDPNIKILTKIVQKEDEKKMLLAGANRTISPYEVGAIKAYRIIQKPKVSRVLDQLSRLKSKISITEIEIPKNSSLDGVYLKDAQIVKESNLIFLGILDVELGEKFIFFSKGINHKLDGGDILIAIGNKKDIRAFEKKIWQ